MVSRVGGSVNNLINNPETMERLPFPFHNRGDENQEGRGGVFTMPVDILDTPNDYHFILDVPGFSKTDIKVTVEDDKSLVIQSNGKRKREDVEDEACRYLRLERLPLKLPRKFLLPDNANVPAITAKCENGVLTVVVPKHPQTQKSKIVQVTIV